MATLKPCPFCGSEQIGIDTLKGFKRTRFKVQCEGCAASTGWKLTEAEAITSWLIRASETNTASLQHPALSPWAWRATVYP